MGFLVSYIGSPLLPLILWQVPRIQRYVAKFCIFIGCQYPRNDPWIPECQHKQSDNHQEMEDNSQYNENGMLPFGAEDVVDEKTR
jgi:hypothetical protein